MPGSQIFNENYMQNIPWPGEKKGYLMENVQNGTGVNSRLVLKLFRYGWAEPLRDP